jgi:hypothetical protein
MRRALQVCRVVLVIGMLSIARVWAVETVEPWDDGTTPHKRFEVDEAGHRNGHYLEYFRDGKSVAITANYRQDALDGSYLESYEGGRPKIRTSYRAGKRDGRFESFGPDGEPVEVSTYVNGEFEGKRQVWRTKKLVAIQMWKAGSLVTLDGTTAFPRAREEVRRTVERILSGELPSAAPGPKTRQKAGGKTAAVPPAPGATSAALAAAPANLDALREEALRRLRAYRYVCAVPWDDLVAGDGPTLAAQYASLICAKLGHITHTPTNPGLSDEVFQLCASGASDCNLHLGVEMTGKSAVDGWMDDSDPTNIDRVGHRCWSLSLAMRSTGFGFSDGKEKRFVAMYTMDSGRAAPLDVPFVLYPGRGWTPSDMFSSHHAWSVAVDPVLSLRLDLAHASVRLRRLSADYVPSDDEMSIEMMPFDKEHRYGGRSVLIFRPKGLEVADGAAYLAEVSAIDSKTHKMTVFLRWVAGFDGSVPADASGADDDSK